jgi:hypothetical protein
MGNRVTPEGGIASCARARVYREVIVVVLPCYLLIQVIDMYMKKPVTLAVTPGNGPLPARLAAS